jgi:hypothetical protein
MAPQKQTHRSGSQSSRSQQGSQKSQQSGQQSRQQSNTGGTGGHSVANITHGLKGMDFPASKKELIQQAKHNKATKEVSDEIENFEDRQYESMADVMREYGKNH